MLYYNQTNERLMQSLTISGKWNSVLSNLNGIVPYRRSSQPHPGRRREEQDKMEREATVKLIKHRMRRHRWIYSRRRRSRSRRGRRQSLESGAVMQRSRDACNAISNYTNCPIVQKEQDGVLRSWTKKASRQIEREGDRATDTLFRTYCKLQATTYISW